MTKEDFKRKKIIDEYTKMDLAYSVTRQACIWRLWAIIKCMERYLEELEKIR